MVVDDSALFRALLRDAMSAIPDISVVGNAKDGGEALERIAALKPDAITLDVEMPGMNGIEVLRELKRRGDAVHSVMVSRHTARGAQVTTDALLEGAFDFVLKPSGTDVTANRQQLTDSLAQIFQGIQESLSAGTTDSAKIIPDGQETSAARTHSSDIVLIGSSTGGPDALKKILPALPAGFPVPVLVAQHMPGGYTPRLASRLDDICPLRVAEAADGVRIQAGEILIAPGGQHLGIACRGGKWFAKLSNDPPEHGCRPSVDYLFRSAFENLPEQRILGVILTGMGSDGTEGSALLKDCGGRIIAQHASECVVYGMPKSVIENGLADRVVSLKHMAAAIRSEV